MRSGNIEPSWDEKNTLDGSIIWTNITTMFCCHCDEIIVLGEPYRRYANGPLAHRECFLRGLTLGEARIVALRGSWDVTRATSFDVGDTAEDSPRAAVQAWDNHRRRN